jgi:hypothetical protein
MHETKVMKESKKARELRSLVFCATLTAYMAAAVLIGYEKGYEAGKASAVSIVDAPDGHKTIVIDSP